MTGGRSAWRNARLNAIETMLKSCLLRVVHGRPERLSCNTSDCDRTDIIKISFGHGGPVDLRYTDAYQHVFTILSWISSSRNRTAA